MRAQKARGFRGIDVFDAVARRAAPADAPPFWPTELLRRRAAAADLAGATHEGPMHARLAATSALLRELSGWSLLIWTLVPLAIAWSGRFPLRCSPPLFFGCAATVAAARWVASRLTYGIGLHPLREARAAAYDTPGSIFAMSSAITGRVRPIYFRIPDQPLLAAALVLSLLTTVALIDRAPVSNHSADVPVALAIVELVVMWLFAVRAVGKRAWERSAYRLATDIAVLVDGSPARAVNASPEGLAVVGQLPEMARGSVVSISIPLSDTTTLETTARVAARRTTARGAIVGLSLSMDHANRVRWIRELFSAAGVTTPRTITETRAREGDAMLDREGGRAHVVRRVVARAELLVVGATAAIALATLTLLGLGYRPLIVRSASMAPTLLVGDVVVVEWTRAADLHTGAIITLEDPETGELLTHRIRHIAANGNAVEIETRGDANDTSEYFTRAPRAVIARVDWTIPRVGRAVTDLGSPYARWTLGVISVALGLAIVGASGRRSNRPARAETRPRVR
jgi:signal peptidase I